MNRSDMVVRIRDAAIAFPLTDGFRVDPASVLQALAPRAESCQLSGDFLYGLFVADDPQRHVGDLRVFTRRAVSELEAKASAPLWAGVGYSPEGFGPAKELARRAVEHGRAVWHEPRVVLHEDVVVFETIAKDDALLRRLAAIIDPVLAYDAEHGTDLVATLHAWSECDLSQVQTARRLGVHRHTVGWRLDAAEQLLGRSVRMGADRSLVELALKAARLRVRNVSQRKPRTR